MTLGELFREGKGALEASGVAEWELDAWYLLEYAIGCTKSSYYMDCGRPVEDEAAERYRALIRKRGCRVPLQYLTGSQAFMGYSFLVTEDVLIPRQDTEILVETALAYIRPGMDILDLCTGSGCILLSILKLIPEVSGVGTDVSEKALLVAEENRKRLGVAAEFQQSDLFKQVEGAYDRILSNPPYIPSEVIGTLMEEVRGYEPRLALDGGEDGLCCYREIIRQSPGYLKSGGMLFLEIGYDQAEAVTGLMKQDFTGIHVVKDLAGLCRVVYGSRKP